MRGRGRARWAASHRYGGTCGTLPGWPGSGRDGSIIWEARNGKKREKTSTPPLSKEEREEAPGVRCGAHSRSVW